MKFLCITGLLYMLAMVSGKPLNHHRVHLSKHILLIQSIKSTSSEFTEFNPDN